MKKNQHFRNFLRDLFLLALSIVFTIFLVKFGILDSILSATEGWSVLSSFVAGFFWTSIFTISPASMAIAHLAEGISPTRLALWGALGAMIGDLYIFYFIRDVFSEDVKGVIKASRFKRLLSKTHFNFLRWFGPLIGALVIVSPLPDEIGLSLMGVSKMKTKFLIPMTFVLNFFGIYLIASASHLFGV